MRFLLLSAAPRWVIGLALMGCLAACSPSLSPLYRDYDVHALQEADTDVMARLRTALTEAGWTLGDADVPNAITTQPRTLSNWGLYRVTASLEAVPIGDSHVRVYYHPYRHYITGGRSKIPYLSGSLQRALLPDLNETLQTQGLVLIGTPYSRDQVAAKP